jgi:hypothetical protein
MSALEITWKIYCCSFSFLFQFFFCEESGRCVSGRPDGYLVCLDGDFGCSDDTVVSSGHSWFLSGRPCFCVLLRGTTSWRHLCSVRTVNPVGWNRFLPAPQPTFLPLLWFFIVLCVFLVFFMHSSHVHVSSLDFISTPGIFLYSFTNLFLSFLWFK